MNNQPLSQHGKALLDRRGFLGQAGTAMGSLGLASLLAKDLDAASEGKTPIRPQIDPNNPYAPRQPHHDAAAKQVLVIYCPGAVSAVDTFDYKPDLFKFHGKKPPGIPAVTFEGQVVIFISHSGILNHVGKVEK